MNTRGPKTATAGLCVALLICAIGCKGETSGAQHSFATIEAELIHELLHYGRLGYEQQPAQPAQSQLAGIVSRYATKTPHSRMDFQILKRIAAPQGLLDRVVGKLDNSSPALQAIATLKAMSSEVPPVTGSQRSSDAAKTLSMQRALLDAQCQMAIKSAASTEAWLARSKNAAVVGELSQSAIATIATAHDIANSTYLLDDMSNEVTFGTWEDEAPALRDARAQATAAFAAVSSMTIALIKELPDAHRYIADELSSSFVSTTIAPASVRTRTWWQMLLNLLKEFGVIVVTPIAALWGVRRAFRDNVRDLRGPSAAPPR